MRESTARRTAETHERMPNGSDVIDGWQDVLMEPEAHARDLIRKHPVAAIVLAGAVGFVAARIMRSAD